MNSKLETKANEYEIKGNVAYLKLRKKNGSFIDTKIDAEDLTKVLEKGIWCAEWHKDFNNYLVQNIIYTSINGKKHIEKQTLHSFIMGTHPKVPIRHCNGDTLDNRKSNLEIYNQNDKINDYEELDKNTIAIILRDKYGIKKAKSLIDKKDLDRVINKGYTWVYYKSNGKPYAVANSPEGRIYLNRYIMDTPENAITHHINLNTLDNRKCNLENVVKDEDSQNENL
nr:hypothetical protein [Clostridium lundense]